jgi:hypothetical protein
MTIYTYLDLSTAHLTQRTTELLEQVADHKRHDSAGGQPVGWPAMTISAYEYGFFITVPEHGEDLDQVPEDLRTVLKYAQKIGVCLLRFDRDADEQSDLPRYVW